MPASPKRKLMMRRGDGRDRADAMRPAPQSYTDGVQASPLKEGIGMAMQGMQNSAPIKPRLSAPGSDKVAMWDRLGFQGQGPTSLNQEAAGRNNERFVAGLAARGQMPNKMLQLGAGSPPPNAPGLQATGPVPDMSAMANILQRKAPPPGLGRYGLGGTDAISSDILNRRKNTMGY